MTAPEFKDLRATFDDQGEGTFRAVFSTFNAIDLDGDVTAPTAFTDGQAVRLLRQHRWDDDAIGKGTIGVDETQAWIDGEFFLKMPAAQATYESVKGLGDLQEWSYGFEVKEAHGDEVDGKAVRVLDRVEVFEVSPVTKGAGVGTHTESIKGLTFAAESDMALAAIRDFAERAKALAATREKSGRVLSSANRERINRHLEAIREIAADFEELLVATEPAKSAVDVRQEWLRFQAIIARTQGVRIT